MITTSKTIIPKAIAVDLDGTLLHSNNRISERTMKSLQAFQHNGGQIIVATGRPPRIVLPVLPELKVADYLIYYNGALVTDNLGKWNKHQPIKNSLAQEIHQAVLQHHPEGILLWEVEDEWYAHRLLDEEEKGWFVDPPDSLVPTLLTDATFNTLEPSKLLLPQAYDFQSLFTDFADRLNISRLNSGPFVEIVEKSVSKASALHYVLHQIQIHYHEVAVFGDDFNDIAMFKSFPHSIAMANAIAELKALSSGITLSNDEDGVAVKVESWLS